MPAFRPAATAIAVFAALLAVLWLVPSGKYIFLPDEAHAVAPVVSVQGEKPDADGGGIFYVDVLVRKATLLERFFPGLRSGASVVPAHAVRPPGVSDQARRKVDLREMARSQEVAAAVALRALGYEVDAKPRGALVTAVLAGAPAEGKLKPSDIITAVGSGPVETPDDLRRLIGPRTPGDEIQLTIRDGETLRKVKVVTAADPDEASRAVIGVLVQQAAEIELPIDVEIDTGDVGGPSAGLAFALDVLEELGENVDRGYKVAATGAIELDGAVIPIGGVKQKTIGARNSGVEVFLVPAGDNAREAARHAGPLRVIPVHNFRQALRALATLPKKR